MTRYFITGGLGFVGYHITKELLQDNENDRIILYDAQKHFVPLSESRWPFYSQYRRNELSEYSDRVTILRGDTTNRGLLKESLEKHEPDKILHLAALPIASVSNEYPDEAHKNILNGTITLLDVLKSVNFDFDRFVYTSSSMVYGDFDRDDTGNIVPPREEDECEPIGIYGAMKLSGEVITRSYGHRFDLPYSIVRPSAVYGPTDCNKRVTEIFVMNALQGERLRLDNGGHHKLDFTYVKDLAQGFLKVANREEALGETFNLTHGEGRSIRTLAEVVSEYVDGVTTYEKQIDVSRPNRGQLDVSKARRLLDYEPRHSLEEGMKKYIAFVRENFPDS